MVEDLVSDDAAHFKALLVANRVDDHVAMNANEVLAVENGVLVLTSCIDHLDRKILILVSNYFAKGVLDGGVIGVDEMAVDILHADYKCLERVASAPRSRQHRRECSLTTECDSGRLEFARKGGDIAQWLP
nr:hypothetical protein CFP56_33699 [Quercus suber]